jgi:isopenicillin-N epimerase
MVSRRHFLGTAVIAGMTTIRTPRWRRSALVVAREAAASVGARSNTTLASDETYWREIQRAFAVDRSLVYLNSASVSPTPSHVLDEMIAELRRSHAAPVEFMWRELEPRVEVVRRELAAEFGCDPEEIAVTRNASEAMETMIFGLDLRRGDEVVVTTQNYDRMLTAWDQRARRDGIVVRIVSVPLRVPSDAVVLDAIRAALTPRTRAIELPHLTNWTGQPFPIADVVALGRAHGIEVFVDGAQAFAHVPATRDVLGCDYYGVSLHKWLLAPVGTGFLYVRTDKQPALWPLMAAPGAMTNSIRKYEEVGTHPAANHNAIVVALAFHRTIGGARKLARLRYLRDRWARALLAESPRVRIPTPLDDPRSGAVALLEIEGLEPTRLHDWLWTRHRIVTSPTVHANVSGIRVTPNVFTTVDEVDRFTAAVRTALRNGLS